MITRIIVPEGGQTSSEVVLVEWHKSVGEQVERGELLFSVETDKAVLDIESCGKGILLETYFKAGETVSTGEIVAYVGDPGEKPPPKFQENGASQNIITQDDEYQPILRRDETLNKQVKHSSPQNEPLIVNARKLLASPAARRLAKNRNIDLADVANVSGKPVKCRDVENYLSGIKADGRTHTVHQFSKIRRTVARRMVESVNTIPAFTVTADVDMDECIKFRKELNESLRLGSIKISFNDIIMKCACLAIKKFPIVNSSFTEDGIREFHDVNFGLAVGLDTGLIVPLVKGANTKTIHEIAAANMENIELARQGKLLAESLSGGTITLSNLGMFGVKCFTAIINPPESCILAAGEIAERAVSRNGQIISRPVMTVTASFDHRTVDGATGAAFLKELKALLENPRMMKTDKE